MDKKYALVTGSSQGIGKAIALQLARDCTGVAIHYRQAVDKAQAVVDQIQQQEKLSHAFQADLTNENEAAGLIHEVEAKFGQLDILVNNFGPLLVKPWGELTSQDWEYMFKGNLLSANYCVQAVLPGMRERNWGRIINLGYSRVEQLTAFTTITPYAIAKSGLLILTRSVAAAEAPHGITVNMVSPGLMEGGVMPKKMKIPAGRFGKPQDIANAVQFFVSPEADYITGTNLVVAGGWKL